MHIISSAPPGCQLLLWGLPKETFHCKACPELVEGTQRPQRKEEKIVNHELHELHEEGQNRRKEKNETTGNREGTGTEEKGS